MIIEVNSKLLDAGEHINLNQLIFLNLVLDKNQKQNQDVRKIVSLISDDEIQDLINQGLITSVVTGNATTYTSTEKLNDFVKPEKDYFDVFYEMYPVYVIRPDGIKTYLRANVNKCRHLFNTYVGHSDATAEHIISCLKFEINKKTSEGKICYLKTMWRWLVDHQWEEAEAEMQDQVKQTTNAYGTELI